jgi:hypothetical protein
MVPALLIARCVNLALQFPERPPEQLSDSMRIETKGKAEVSRRLAAAVCVCDQCHVKK